MILKNFKVKIPSKTVILPNNYVYYEKERVYDKVKKYTAPKRVCIGKAIDEEYMNPNERYKEYFKDESLLKEPPLLSDSISVGFNVVLDKIFNDTQIDILLKEIYSEDEYKSIRDIVSYIISNETSVIQHYPSYARKTNILSDSINSDSYYSSFFKDVITDRNNEVFLKAWNLLERKQDKLYISFDSTNMNTNSLGINLAEYGHPKQDEDLPQVNLSLAINQKESLPLFYDLYPGSNIDNTELKYMVERLNEYGYKDLGVILDRGYYSKQNIDYLRNNEYDFLLMVKSNNQIIHNLIKEYRYRLPKAKYFIDNHDVYGTTIITKLFESDKEDSYIHLYFDSSRSADETKDLYKAQTRLSKELDNHIKTHKKKDELKKSYKSFKLKADREGYLVSYMTNEDYLDSLSEELGFFCIVTSKEMTANEALDIYRDRDTVEKLFESLKSEMDYSKYRVHSTSSLRGKTFIIFIASIIRSRIYHLTKPLKEKSRKEYTVPSIINELNKIEATKNGDDNYVRRYSLTAKQKNILNKFNIIDKDVDIAINDLNNRNLKKQ